MISALTRIPLGSDLTGEPAGEPDQGRLRRRVVEVPGPAEQTARTDDMFTITPLPACFIHG